MRIKKWIAVMLAMLMLASIFPLTVLAENPDVDSTLTAMEDNTLPILPFDDEDIPENTGADIRDWTYTNKDGIVTLTGYTGSSTDVIIPTNGDFGEDIEKVHISSEVMKRIVNDTKATSIVVSKNGNKVIADGEDWSDVFSGINLKNVDLSHLETGGISNMKSLFSSCYNMTELNLSGWNTKHVTNMSRMFFGCGNLENLDLSSFDTSNVNRMVEMFNRCEALKRVNVSSFNTENVTDMGGMFCFCSSLTELDVTNFDTRNLISMNCPNTMSSAGMFFCCSSLKSLDLSSFDTSKVVYMDLLFSNCKNLQTIFVSDLWSTKNVTYSESMFSLCNNLVGGSGTTFDSSCIDKTYAHVDGGTENPGYFTKKIQKGDITKDGKIDMSDAHLAKQIAMKDSTIKYDALDMHAGDLNGDGKITINEARKIKRAVTDPSILN